MWNMVMTAEQKIISLSLASNRPAARDVARRSINSPFPG